MPTTKKQLVVFVHGWSVTHTNTYGGLPQRLGAEAAKVGLRITTKEVFLGQYVSFRDEVRLEDIARAFEAAVERELTPLIKQYGRFACLTHSTGGPVIRHWAQHYHVDSRQPCPMSHLVMLAPANFGSALAQLGKGRLSRIKSWFEGVEPGEGVLDWLELGSRDAWALNAQWVHSSKKIIGDRYYYPFVITGQTIDRKLYDNLNSYTGEDGSDGVVRVAAANLNVSHVVLEQESVKANNSNDYHAAKLLLTHDDTSRETALLVVAGKSHCGKAKGIMSSISRKISVTKDRATIDGILKCLVVDDNKSYKQCCHDFAKLSAATQTEEQVEIEKRILLLDNHFIHDRYTMVIFRLQDQAGHAISDYDILLTAGGQHDPNLLPRGFFQDRQKNKSHPGTITYYLNYDIMMGCDAVVRDGKIYRPPQPGLQRMGLKIIPRPNSGFVHYLPCDLQSTAEVLKTMIKPNRTIMVEIVLHRVIHEGVFRLKQGFKQHSFKKEPPGKPLMEHDSS